MTTEERIGMLEAQLGAQLNTTQVAMAGECRRDITGRGHLVPIICIVGLVGFFLGVMCTDVIAHPTDDAKDEAVLSVKALQIVDDEGRKRIVLDVSDGKARIRVLDEEGKARVSMYAGSKESSIALQDGEEQPRAALGSGDGQGPTFALVDNSGGGGVMLHALHNSPSLGMRGANGQGSIMLELTPRGPLLVLLDGDGDSVWSAPTKENVK